MLNETKKETTEIRLKEIFANLFGLSQEKVFLEDSIYTIEQWTSLMHLRLVSEVEKVFEINFEPEDFIKLTSFKKLLELIEKKVH